MSNAPPMYFDWDGEAMVPCKPKLADKYFVVGMKYRLIEEHERSLASHNHQFAWLRDAYLNLPEKYDGVFDSPDHLRQWALIQCNFCHTSVIDLGSNKAAAVMAEYLQRREPFAEILATGEAVVVKTAESQKLRLMGKKRFEESKQAILELISGMLNVDPETLKAEAGKAA